MIESFLDQNLLREGIQLIFSAEAQEEKKKKSDWDFYPNVGISVNIKFQNRLKL